jgi:hypothetical protein
MTGELREAVDAADVRVWEARFSGANGAREARKRERDQFAREHFADLDEELARDTITVRDRLVAAHAEQDAAERDYAAMLRRWHRIVGFGNLPPSDIPTNPLRGDAGEVGVRFARGIEHECVRCLVEGRIRTVWPTTDLDRRRLQRRRPG